MTTASIDSIYLNLHQTGVAIAACARAGRVALVFGPPGIAKTTLARAVTPVVARHLGYNTTSPDDPMYPAIDCVLSNRDAVDIGGYPVTFPDGEVRLQLFGTLRQAEQRPGLLILDELTTCTQAVQGPAMRLVLERYAGENPLHKDTRIVCLANRPDQAPGGIQLTATLINRVIIINCQPTVTEISDYFCAAPAARLDTMVELPSDAVWQARRQQLMATAGVIFTQRPDLLCFDPPPAAISDGESFASPRAWEICCDVISTLPSMSGDDSIVQAIAVGTLGAARAFAFLSILKAREHLPSVDDVIKSPDTALVPDETKMIDDGQGGRKQIGRDVTFAAIPLVIEASRIDSWAAWVYIERLPSEIVAAVAKGITSNIYAPAASPWLARGQRIMLDTVRQLGGLPASQVKKAS
jgi:hypothetical protein